MSRLASSFQPQYATKVCFANRPGLLEAAAETVAAFQVMLVEDTIVQLGTLLDDLLLKRCTSTLNCSCMWWDMPWLLLAHSTVLTLGGRLLLFSRCNVILRLMGNLEISDWSLRQDSSHEEETVRL